MAWATSDDPKRGTSGNDAAEENRAGEAASDPATADSRVERPPASDEPEEALVADRPDFTEASSTVGKGRVQLESGDTFIRDRSGGAASSSHSYPEALLRVGVFADWFEFRLGQNFGTARTGSPDGVFSAAGAEDLYLGAKLGLTEQKGVFPELALVVQAQVQTGHTGTSPPDGYSPA